MPADNVSMNESDNGAIKLGGNGIAFVSITTPTNIVVNEVHAPAINVETVPDFLHRDRIKNINRSQHNIIIILFPIITIQNQTKTMSNTNTPSPHQLTFHDALQWTRPSTVNTQSREHDISFAGIRCESTNKTSDSNEIEAAL